MAEQKLATLANAPHIKTPDSVSRIMWTVVAALAPAVIFSIYIVGLQALVLYGTAVVTSILLELLFQKGMKQSVTAFDGSAVITGLLIAMIVPPSTPWWVVAIGAAFAIIIVKQLFGGLGYNVFNPAFAARAFLLASWPVHLTTGWHNFAGVGVLSENAVKGAGIPSEAFDAITAATPLSVLKEGPKILAEHGLTLEQLHDVLLSPDVMKSLFIGNIGGSLGETSALFIILGGLFMLWRRVITWHIPVSFIGTVALLSLAYYGFTGYPAPHLMTFFHLMTGGLMLGAFFMATDMVTSPVTPKGMLIFGFGAGFITFVIRIWGGYPEGVAYSVLLMNSVTPLIDRWTRPRVFGTDRGKGDGDK